MFWFIFATAIVVFFSPPFTKVVRSEQLLIETPKRQIINDIILPDCSVDGDCANFALASFCTKFSCINGSCTKIDNNPCNSSIFESCNEKTQSCVGCSLLMSDSRCSSRNSDYLTTNNLSFCDVNSIFTCNVNHPVVKSSDQTEIGRVLYGDCVFTEYNTSNSIRCQEGASISGTPFCSSSLSACVECITDVDCLIRFGLVTKSSTSPSEYMDSKTQQPTVVPGCLPPVICSKLDGKCYFHSVLPSSQTVPFSNDTSIYDVLSSQVFYINYSDASKGYKYWSTKHLSHIMEDPCDTLEQKNATGGENVISCSPSPNSGTTCLPVTCTTDSECDDLNECNGKEFCSSGTCRYSIENTCSAQFNGMYPFCDETTKTCETCLSDSDCENSSMMNPCYGMGYCEYNPTTKRNVCSVIPRCNYVTETCSGEIINSNVLESVLLQFSYSVADNGLPEIPENLGNRSMRNWRTLNTYDDVSFYIQETFLANQDFNKKNGEIARQSPYYIDPVGTTLDEQITSFVNSFLALDTKKTGFLPLDFDSRRIYCKSIYCTTNGDCPTGTICTTYSKFNQTRKKCVTCDHDHQCQDGVKCNGREKCHHSEGTCRRSKYPLCYNKSLNRTFPCEERSGRCIGGGNGGSTNSIKSNNFKASQSDHVTNRGGIDIDTVPPPPPPEYIPVSQSISSSSMGAVLSITLVVSLAAIFAAVLLYVSAGGSNGQYSENAKFHRKKKYG